MECWSYVQRCDELRSESAFHSPEKHLRQDQESFLAFDAREREQKHNQEVTVMQKDLEFAKSLIQTSSEQKTFESDKGSVGRTVNVA